MQCQQNPGAERKKKRKWARSETGKKPKKDSDREKTGRTSEHQPQPKILILQSLTSLCTCAFIWVHLFIYPFARFFENQAARRLISSAALQPEPATPRPSEARTEAHSHCGAVELWQRPRTSVERQHLRLVQCGACAWRRRAAASVESGAAGQRQAGNRLRAPVRTVRASVPGRFVAEWASSVITLQQKQSKIGECVEAKQR